MPIEQRTWERELAKELIWDYTSPFRKPMDLLSLGYPPLSEVQEFIKEYSAVRPVDITNEAVRLLFDQAVKSAIQSSISAKLHFSKQGMPDEKREVGMVQSAYEYFRIRFMGQTEELGAHEAHEEPEFVFLETELSHRKEEIEVFEKWQRNPWEVLDKELQQKIAYIRNTLLPQRPPALEPLATVEL